jgi:preprotein translocase subunit SecG
VLYYIIVTIHVLVSLFLILVVLLQTGKSGDLASAFGGGGSQTVFGPRGTSNVLTKITTGAAVLFMITSLTLVFLSQQTSESVVDTLEEPRPAAETEAPTSEPAMQVPAEGETTDQGQGGTEGTGSQP